MDNFEMKAFSEMEPAEVEAYSAGYNEGYQLGFRSGYAAGVSTAQHIPKTKISDEFWLFVVFGVSGLVGMIAFFIFLNRH